MLKHSYDRRKVIAIQKKIITLQKNIDNPALSDVDIYYRYIIFLDLGSNSGIKTIDITTKNICYPLEALEINGVCSLKIHEERNTFSFFTLSVEDKTHHIKQENIPIYEINYISS